MHRWISGSILLILVVGHSTAETVQKDEIELITLNNGGERGDRGILIQTDSGKLDYETALRPAVLQKRSIANIARLLLGGNVPPNHPLVKYPESKTWNLASNIMAALPGASPLQTSATTGGWGQPPAPKPTALENIQQLFETKAKIIPYTGQVATGLTGLASVKGDLIRQIHSISTQAIAQAAAEAAARALASAAAAHAVTNSISHAVNPGGAQTGIKGGWSSSYPSYYPDGGRVPSDQPGPPYSSSSAHINNYQAPGGYRSNNVNPFASPVTTPAPPAFASPTLSSPLSQNYGGSDPYQNGYYTLYNTQQQQQQTPSYTPPPPVGHARPTISPNTLIATTPSGYNPSLISSSSSVSSSDITTSANIPRSSSATTTNDDNSRGGRTLITPPVVIYTGKSRPHNVTPLTSFRRAVPAGIFGRHAAQPASTTSLLSSISSLLSASTAAYNAAFTGGPPAAIGGSQPPSAIFSNLLSSSSSPSSPSGSQGGRPASSFHSPGSSYHGGHPGSSPSGFLHHHPQPPVFSSATEARPSTVHPPGYSFSTNGAGNAGAGYAQSGANSYHSAGVQSSPNFGPNSGSPGSGPPGSYSTSGGASTGSGGSFLSGSGAGYSGNYAGPGSSTGHVGGWNTVHAGSPFGQASWPGSQSSGYPGQATGNFNNSPGSYGAGSSSNYIQTAPGSALAQPAYPPVSQNAYQSPATHAYAAAQQSAFAGFAPASSTGNYGGGGNSYLNSYQRQDQSLSASTMGNNEDYDDDLIDTDNLSKHSYQQEAQRRSRPGDSYGNKNTKNDAYSNSRLSAKKKPAGYQHGKKSTSGGGRVIPTGNKKGSQIDSQVDVVHVDNDYNGDDDDKHSSEYENDDYLAKNKKVQPVSNKNRWRSQNSSGQRPNPLHDNHSNGGWRGKASDATQASPKNVRGSSRRPEGTRPQSGQPRRRRPTPLSSSQKTKQYPRGDKKNKRPPPPPSKNGKGAPPKKWAHQKTKVTQDQKTSTTDKHFGGGGGGARGSTLSAYKSRDVYTTLPEYVFRVDERPDVFIRPAGKRTKSRAPFWRGGLFHGRAGETVGGGGSRTGSERSSPSAKSYGSDTLANGRAPQKDNIETASETEETSDHHFGEEAWSFPVVEQERRQIIKTAAGGGETEELGEVAQAPDETARADTLEESPGFITSEEFDPEEREAFVDDVYADDHLHLNRRNDDTNQDEDDTNTEDDQQADLIDKKR